MTFKTILVSGIPGITTVTFNRPELLNTINEEFLIELNRVLDQVERDCDCKMLILKGQRGVFCTGMDFEAALSHGPIDVPDETMPANHPGNL